MDQTLTFTDKLAMMQYIQNMNSQQKYSWTQSCTILTAKGTTYEYELYLFSE
jgi:hypothetical protein